MIDVYNLTAAWEILRWNGWKTGVPKYLVNNHGDDMRHITQVACAENAWTHIGLC
ncbi:hypothetical protein [Kaarinaea lacus]